MSKRKPIGRLIGASPIVDGEVRSSGVISTGEASGSIGAFDINNTLRFDDTNDYMSLSVPDGDRTKWTWSAWVKIADPSTRTWLFSGGPAGDLSNLFYTMVESSANGNGFRVSWRDNTPTDTKTLETTASYDQTDKWYHFVLVVNTGQSSATDKMKLYVDGVDIDTTVDQYTTDNRANLPANPTVNQAGVIVLGTYAYNVSSTSARLNGQLAEVHFVDGQALTAADFGEYNSDGVWVPKQVTDIDYGYNGFYLDFKGNDTGVTLLLDGSSATTDSSSANIASNLIAASGVTATDTTTLGISHPYGSSAVNVLDFSNQTGGISHTSSSILPLLDPEDTQWTLEMWVRPESFATYDYLIAQATDGATGWNDGLEWILDWDTTNIYFVGHNGGSNTSLLQANLSAYGITLNNWHHVAVVRDGSDTMMFLNGTKAATVTNQNAVKISGKRHLFIGTDPTDTYAFEGQMTDIRITKGVARYTDSFTPPTSALSTDVSRITGSDDVVLKLNADNSLTDETGRHTPTGAGVSYSTDVPFTSGNSHSFSFSPTATTDVSEVITLPNSTDFQFGADPFTVEMWFKWDGTAGLQILFNTYEGTGVSGLAIAINGATLACYCTSGGGWNMADAASGGITFTANTWHHLAIVRYPNGYIEAFKDGVKGTSPISTSTASIFSAVHAATQELHNAHIGGSSNYYAFNGLIDDVRITKGAALYPFYPPISALTNTPEYHGDFGVDRTTDGTGVTLLLDGEGASITDKSSSSNTITPYGDTKVDTNIKKFGSGSIKFDGSGDYLNAGNVDALGLADGDWTIECWVRPGELTDYQVVASYGGSVAAWNSSDGQQWVFMFGASAAYFQFWNGSSYTDVTGNHGMSLNTWHHMAASRSGNTIRLFIDGNEVASSGVNPDATTEPDKLVIGVTPTLGAPFQGYIDDFRITRGVARYSGSFTPPTSALSTDVSGITGSDDVVLMLNGVTATDQSSANTGLTNNGVAVNQNSQSHPYASGALLFDGTDDLTITTENNNLYLGTDDWTIEGWFRTTNLSTTNTILEYRTSGGDNGAGKMFIGVTSNSATTGQVGIYENTVYQAQSATDSIVANTWYHLAFVRNGGTVSVFIDGSLADSGSLSSSTVDILRPTSRPIIGGFTGGGYNWIGEWVDFRITKGAALYPFYPPISALTNDDTCDKPKNNFTVEGNITPDDQLLDTPNLRFAALDASNLSDANLTTRNLGTNTGVRANSYGQKSSGKWYWETSLVDTSPSGNHIGIWDISETMGVNYIGQTSGSWGLYLGLGATVPRVRHNGTYTEPSGVTAFVSGDIISIAIDLDSGKMWYAKNGVWFESGNPSTGTGDAYDVATNPSKALTGTLAPADIQRDTMTYNFGQDHTFAGAKGPLLTPYSDANGVGEFYYEPPEGFLALAEIEKTKVNTVQRWNGLIGNSVARRTTGGKVIENSGIITTSEHYQSKL